jgi:RNA polymerase sigma-70 factor (ECF subfamily)
LVDLINKLPTASRVVFNMKVVDNFTHKEIAKRLNISVGSSKSNYSYARVRLQKFIKQYFEGKIV